MLGKVTKVNDSYVTVEVSELAEKPVEIIMQKSSVSAVLPKGNHQGPVRVTWCCAGPAGPAARQTPPGARAGRTHPDMK